MFGTWPSFQAFGGWISLEEVEVDNIDVAAFFLERVGDFVKDILFHGVEPWTLRVKPLTLQHTLPLLVLYP